VATTSAKSRLANRAGTRRCRQAAHHNRAAEGVAKSGIRGVPLDSRVGLHHVEGVVVDHGLERDPARLSRSIVDADPLTSEW
jgi:hypothetical protein